MRRRLPQSGLIIAASAVAALMLSFAKPSPEGLVGFGVGEREVRAAPGSAISTAQSAHNLTALRVFNRTLVRVRDSYVDPSRIDPKAMLYAALDSVQFHIPEVMIDADEDADTVTVHVSDVTRQFSTAGVDSPWRLSGRLKEIFRFIEANMNPGADLAAVEYAAVNGMLSTLDPHSVLLDPDAAREMDVSTSGKFGGLGIVIEMRDRKLTVVEPMADTPAARAGIESGDHIARIDEEVTENLTLSEAVERMRGHPGSRVTLWIEREGVTDLVPFELTRAQIQVPSVESELLSGGVGYLNVKQFASRTANELREHMDRLEAEGAKAWILDLRRNPGGLLEQAILVADLFVDTGTLVTTVGGREREPRRATRKGSETEKPMAVLVSGVSASASEIVAGSLKNLDRAIVLGSTTFGKGSVQILYDNEDGSKLKLTIAEYLTPGDRSIQSLGIVPDIELQRMFVPRARDGAAQQVRLLPPTRRHGEADLKAHLDSEYAVQSSAPKTSFRYLHELEQDDEPLAPEASEDELDPLGDGGVPDEPLPPDELPPEDASRDVPVELARHLLTRVGSPSRGVMFDRSRPLLDRRAAIEQRKLERALSRLGVDWSPAPQGASGAPRLEGSFTIEADGGAIRAGERIVLRGEVANTGDAAAHQVLARVEEADYALFQDVELVFGRIEPGESRTWTTQITVPQSARDRIDVLSFALRSAEEAPSRSEPLKVRVEAAPRPVFAYSHHLIDEGNGDGLIQRGERHRLRVTVRNSGEGASRDTTAILRNASGDGVLVRKGRFEIGALEPGESHTIDFLFDVTERLRASELVVEMTVYDRVLQESVNETLTYAIAAPSAGPSPRQGWARISAPQTPIFQGASSHSKPIAHAARGASFPITGEIGNWLRVELGDRLPGFVRADAVTQGRSGRADPDLEPHWHVQPPTLELSFPSYETSSPTYTLTGTVKDDERVEDVYIFISNRGAKIQNRKVFYQSNRSSPTPGELPFSAELPLWPGTNQVTVVARKNDDVRATHTVYLYRHTSNSTASAAARIVAPAAAEAPMPPR
jgi:carboxyl-terminal processing protease